MASLLILLWPLKRHIQRQSVKLTIAGEKLRYETGLASKSTRIIQLPKVQDVRAVQSLASGCSAWANLSIETAGEDSRLIVANLDNPQQLAEADHRSRRPCSGGGLDVTSRKQNAG